MASLALLVVTPIGAQVERAVLDLPAAAVEMRAAALLMSGQEGGDLEMLARAFVGPDVVAPKSEGAADDGFETVLAVVEIDGVGVMEAARAQEQAGLRPTLEIFVYVVGPSLDVLDAVALRLDRPAEHEAQLLGAGVRVLAPLRLDDRATSLAVSGDGPEIRILVRAGDSFGLRRVAVPEPVADGSDQAGAAETAEMDGSGRWLVAWPTERPADGPAAGLAFEPASGQPSAFEILPEMAEMGERARSEGQPAGLENEPWPALLRRHGAEVLTGVMPTQRAEIQLPEELGRKLQAVLDSYLEAVARRAGGDTHGAAYFLAQLESRAMDELGNDALQLLLGQEVRAFQRLRDRLDDVHPLIALIRLHLDVADEHRREGRYLLSSFAMGTAVRITDWYAEEADRSRKADELRGEAAAVLSSLAGAAKLRGGVTDAIGYYHRALSYRPDDPVALFGLATALSKFGEPAEAADLYEKLLEQNPDHHEARLRWGVMLQRMGGSRDLRRAEELFRPLAAADSSAPQWIASLAAQQLVRMKLDAGELRDASRVLDAALERWPEHGPLRFAAIRLAELQGDRQAVEKGLSVFDPAASSPMLLPGGRIRFHQAPDEGLRGLRARLAKLEEARRPELAAAVEKIQKRRGSGP